MPASPPLPSNAHAYAVCPAVAPLAALVTVGVCEFSAAPSSPVTSALRGPVAVQIRSRRRHVGRGALVVPRWRVRREEGALATVRSTSVPQGGRANKNGEMGVVRTEPEAMGRAGWAVVGAP